MFIDYLLPNKLVGKFDSEFNGEIEVRTEFGRPRVVVRGIPQSGGIVQDILKRALDEFDSPESFLLLGLGGGAILHEVSKRWLGCKIRAVEIDPVMIEVAKKHFKVGEIENLEIINEDAVEFLKRPGLASVESSQGLAFKYDAVLVDCYLGDQVPKGLESEEFLRNLKSLMSPNSRIAFNRIISPKEFFVKTQMFVARLGRIFGEVKTKRAYCNLMIVVK